MYLEQTGGQIVIRKVSNGFIVILPQVIMNEQARQLSHMMPVIMAMKKSQDGDPFLDELRGVQQVVEVPEPVYGMAITPNMFICPHIADVLDLLEKHFGVE